jgi:transposase-like protein
MSKLNWEQFEQEALEKLKKGEELGGKDGVMAPLIKHLLETALESELDIHLSEEKSKGKSNRRNGGSKKGLKTTYGKIDLETSRDRTSSFEPKIVKKRQTTLGEGLDNKIISMYSPLKGRDELLRYPISL